MTYYESPDLGCATLYKIYFNDEIAVDRPQKLWRLIEVVVVD